MWWEQFKAFDREHALARQYAKRFFVAAKEMSHGAYDETTVLEQDKRGAIQRFAKRKVRAYDATRDDALAARYWRHVQAAMKDSKSSRLSNYLAALDRHAFRKGDRFAPQLHALNASKDATAFWLSVDRLHINVGKAALAFLKARNIANPPLVSKATYHFEGTPNGLRFNRDAAIKYLEVNGVADAKRVLDSATA